MNTKDQNYCSGPSDCNCQYSRLVKNSCDSFYIFNNLSRYDVCKVSYFFALLIYIYSIDSTVCKK